MSPPGQQLVFSRSASLSPSGHGTFVVTRSISRRPLELELVDVQVLLAFTRPSTVEEASRALPKVTDLARRVDSLSAESLLVPAGVDGTAGVSSVGFGSVEVHHRMLRDTYRVLTYQAAIARHAAGKRVAEIGCGSGILSLFAAKAGAKSVMAVEETAMADLAAQMFRANGCADRIRLVRRNSRDVEVEEPVEVIIHELYGLNPVRENFLPSVIDARRRWLAPGGRLIPNRTRICCIGVAAPDRAFRTREVAVLEARELSAAYGISFEPYYSALRFSNDFRVPLDFGAGQDFAGRALTDEATVFDIDLMHDDETQPSARFELPVLKSGILGGFSVFFRAQLDERTEVSSSPFLTRSTWDFFASSLAEPVPVTAGQRIPLEASVVDVLSGQDIQFKLV